MFHIVSQAERKKIWKFFASYQEGIHGEKLRKEGEVRKDTSIGVCTFTNNNHKYIVIIIPNDHNETLLSYIAQFVKQSFDVFSKH